MRVRFSAGHHRRPRRLVAGGLGILAVGVLATACLPVLPVLPTVPGAPNCSPTPANNYWRATVTGLPLAAHSADYITTSGAGAGLKADFGSGLWDGGPIGIPFTTVPGTQAKVAVTFTYPKESDKGPYPIPANAPIEGGAASTGDRHVIVVDRDACKLYETWDSHKNADGSWKVGSGAVYDMKSNALRPSGWTSADAAGLPILPGLVNYDEVASGTVAHAIRITVPTTRTSFVWPARHQAGSTSAVTAPPMGTWLRLKSTINPSQFDPAVRPIIVALQKYGAIVADNGSAWYMSGVPDSRWNNDLLQTLGRIKGRDFEVVNTQSLIVDPNSGQATTAS